MLLILPFDRLVALLLRFFCAGRGRVECLDFLCTLLCGKGAGAPVATGETCLTNSPPVRNCYINDEEYSYAAEDPKYDVFVGEVSIAEMGGKGWRKAFATNLLHNTDLVQEITSKLPQQER